MAAPEGFSGLHRVLTGEEAKALGRQIARATGQPEAPGTAPHPTAYGRARGLPQPSLRRAQRLLILQ